jgi:hypothetical protein
VTHPVVLAALAVLLLNDHVLKHAWPGPVTGKLSDVAGPVVAAALLGALARRLSRRAEAAAWLAVAVAFALLKAVPPLNALVPAAGVADATDVAGLVALPFAWRATRRPPPWRPRVAWRAAAVVAAVLAVTATSRVEPPAVLRVHTVDGVVVAYGRSEWGTAYRWASGDGGLRWVPVTGEEPPLPDARSRACSGERCYDVSNGLLRQSGDGGRTWQRATDLPAPVTVYDVTFAGRAVVVAAGQDGVLRRDGPNAWRLLDPDDEDPTQPSFTAFLVRGSVFAGVLMLGLLGICWLFLLVADRTVRASRPARNAAAGAWSPPLPRTRSSPRRSPRHRR